MSAGKDQRGELLRLMLQEEDADLCAVSNIETGPGRVVGPDQAGSLSFSQKRLWFLRQLLGEKDFSYNIPFALRLQGSLDREALTLAVNEIVARHDVLRASFSIRDGQPVQSIAEELSIDIGFLTPRADAIASLVADHARQVFDLETAPLLAVSVIRIAEDDHVLLLNMHHIIADGWSLGIFVSEFSKLYRGAVLQQPVSLPELDIQFSSYAAAQTERVNSGQFDRQLAYWLEQFEQAPRLISLPTDFPRPEKMTGKGGQVKFVISGEIRDAMRALSAERDATLFMALMSAFVVLLHHLGGDEDINVGTPIAGRQSPELEKLIGCFVNTVVIRSRLKPGDHFRALLDQVKLTSLDAFENQELPFEVLVEHLRPERSLGHTPVFQVMLALQNLPMQDFDLPGLTIEPFEQNLEIAKFDLNLNLSERATGISACLEFNTDIFASHRVERIALAYQEILARIVDTGFDTPISKLNVPALEALNDLAPALTGRDPSPPATTAPGIAGPHWERHFAQGKRAQQLPHILPPQPTATPSSIASTRFVPGEETGPQIDALLRSTSVGAAEMMLAAWSALIGRLIPRSDAVMGVCAPPDGVENAGMLDCNWSLLRAPTDGDVSFTTVLDQVRDRLSASRCSALKGGDLMQMWADSPGQLAVFAVSASLSDAMAITTGLARFSPFHLSICEQDGRPSLTVHYDQARFLEADVQAVLSIFSGFLRHIVEQPDKPISEHALLEAPARDEILTRFQAALKPAPPELSLAAPFERFACRHPDDIALIDGDERHTYGALDTRSSQIAHFLTGQGIQAGDRVAVCMCQGVLLVECLYGLVKLGAAYVPINADDPVSRISDMLGNALVRHVLTDRVSSPHLPEGDWAVIMLDNHQADIAKQSDAAITLPSLPARPCYIMHTSGSSGAPKAVQFPTDIAISSMRSLQARYPVERGDVHIFKTPFTFDVSIWEIFWPLYHGGQLVIIKPGGHRDPVCLRDTIEAHGITLINLVPSMLEMFLRALPENTCRSLKWIFSGGESLTPRLRDRCFEGLPQVRLVNLYGPTESHAVADIEINRSDKSDFVSIGKPSGDFRLYLLDDRFEPVPYGVTAELYIGNRAGLAHGYVGQSELTADRFVPDPFTPGGRLYRTGDLCRYFQNGQLEFVERADSQIKLSGVRIEPEEIEQAHLSHAGIAQCIVMAIGEDVRRKLVAFVVPKSGAQLDPDTIRDHVSAILSPALVPSLTICTDAIPLTPSGKTDFASLQKLSERETGPVLSANTPATRTEAGVRDIFERVLNLSGIDLTRSFFELGGHSLMAIQVIADCQTEFDVCLPLQIIYSANSVRALASQIRSAELSRARCLVKLAGPDLVDPEAAEPDSGGAEPGGAAIILLHGAEGSVAPFHRLAQQLGKHASVFSLQAPGLEEGAALCRTVEAYCDYFLSLVRPICLNRDVTVIGWSFGGNIAVELTRKLTASGRPPSRTILLDSFLLDWADGAGATTSRVDAAYQVLARFEYPGLEALGALDGVGKIVERMRAVLDNNLRAFTEYRPVPCAATVHLLEAQQGWPGLTGAPARAYSDGSRGWGRVLSGLVQDRIPGDHFSLLSQGHCQALANKIHEIMELDRN